jgi:hypothetical protein
MCAVFKKEGGFVLVATLWFLATITIVAAYFADQVGKSVESSARSQRMTGALQSMASTRAEAFFHFATDGFSQWGLGLDPTRSIALDDRPYLGTAQDVIQFQDNRGLLNLNFPDYALLGRLLLTFGVPAEKHPALFDALADYTDIDNLRRLNGAEAPEYEAVKLPPPANDWLYSPHQLKAVYGWHLLNDLWDENRFLPLLTTARIYGFNPNTAPREILFALAGSESVSLVEEILALRKSNPILAREKASALTRARSMDSERIVVIPAESIRMTQRSPDLPWAIEINITLTPVREDMPWHIDYFAKTHVKSKTSDEDAIPRLPPPFSVSATALGAP